MSSDFIDYVSELLAPLGSLRTKRMFGGVGVYIDGLFCAIIADEALFFKADEYNEAEFIAAGCEQLSYEKQGEVFVMRYFRVPEHAMDNSQDMIPWARLGMAAALRKAAGSKSNVARSVTAKSAAADARGKKSARSRK